MYKVFLADDEIVVREGIRSNFPWDEAKFTFAGEAPDGEIALSMLQDIKPDILITDIRMPFMDGLALCRAVTRTMPWIYVIILSGYDDFAYAREAISLGVQEYLLKPVSGGELLTVLNRIADHISEEKRKQANLRSIREHLASSGRFLKEKLLLDLFEGQNIPSLMERGRALQIDLTAGGYRVLLLRPSEKLLNRDDWTRSQNILSRMTDRSGGTAYLCETSGVFALLVLGDNEQDLEERAYALAQSAQYDVERSTGVRLAVSIGKSVSALEDVTLSLKDAWGVLGSMDRAPRIMSMQDNIPENTADSHDSKGSARYGGMIRRAQAYIDERYTDSGLTLSDVAAHAAMSNNHFCTVFSQEAGLTFTEHLTAVRIARAKELLLTTGMRSPEIAYAIGYNDPHYFGYLFKKNTGMSPRDFRRENAR
jgi:two-component system response regulator YesN